MTESITEALLRKRVMSAFMEGDRIDDLNAKWGLDHDLIIREHIEQLDSDIKFLLSFCLQDKPPEGLDPTFYHTHNFKGDMGLWERMEKIIEKSKGIVDDNNN